MAEYLGSAQVFQWIWSGGTTDLSAHTRRSAITPTQEVVDATAGSDANRQYITSFTDYAVTWEGVAQDGTNGTAFAQALKSGVSGTLIVGPYGTANGNLKFTIPAFSLGLQYDFPYADVATLTNEWRVSSGGSVTIGNY